MTLFGDGVAEATDAKAFRKALVHICARDLAIIAACCRLAVYYEVRQPGGGKVPAMDPHKRYLSDPKRNERKVKFSRLEVMVFIVIYAIFIAVMLAIVPKDAKWWPDSSPTQSSHR